MNRLRALSRGGGGLVVLLALWATIHYGGSPLRFAPALLVGVVGAGLPAAFAWLKGAVRSLRRRLADADEGFSAEQGSIFVSEGVVDDAVDCLESIRSALGDDERFDEVEREAFEEGPGLSVLHGGFHNSFVRITGAGRVVVTGASEQTGALADLVSESQSLSFERTRDNPFEGAEPVRGAPRVFLGVLVFVVLLAGVNAVGAAAYTADAYNPAERLVLVGIDAQGDADPGVSGTDARLSKAAFLATVVDEGSTEVRWAGNDSGRVAEQGRQALVASRDARRLLEAVRSGSPTADQRDRADRIERRLAEAERSVADALDERADQGAVGETTEISRLSERLRASDEAVARLARA
ncbi:hypothetical protein [Halomicrobium salinisoli]|uniref:hypothetical protein n=1 Tax=Halomicrobium salinisoli TaxID=2878391 RepID=UPI001CF06B7A|nr:hypothetical protein [Halomicrobium salinisoli]